MKAPNNYTYSLKDYKAIKDVLSKSESNQSINTKDIDSFHHSAFGTPFNGVGCPSCGKKLKKMMNLYLNVFEEEYKKDTKPKRKPRKKTQKHD